MRGLRGRHPEAVCVYFLCVLLPVFFGMNPVTAGLGLLSGFFLLARLLRRLPWKEGLGYLGIAAFSGIVNPLFNHNGQTPLFFLNRNPVTLEALLYGLVMGLLIAAVLLWSRCFMLVMDTDRLLTVTGLLSPKFSLMLSMALRFIPLFRRQAEKVREARKGLGLIREDNGIDRMKGAVRVFDGLVTWGLENGITMADSMAARGYGTGKRTRYPLFSWERGDSLLAACSLGILAAVLAAKLLGWIGYEWYPRLIVPEVSLQSIGAYGLFGLLCFAGPALEAAEKHR